MSVTKSNKDKGKGARASSATLTRAPESTWLERINPLRGLSITQADQIWDCARAGNYARIQWLYNAIERVDPVLSTCIDRRTSALVGMGRRITIADDADSLAQEQRDFLQAALESMDNLDEAIEHLELAFFRGYSHVQPQWESDGTVKRFELLDGWNFCRSLITGAWFWNPKATYTVPDSITGAVAGNQDLVEIPPAELCTVARRREVDAPAMTIYLRHAIAERDWGRFIERYGLPPVSLVMPPNMTQEAVAAFSAAAQAIADGKTGSLPSGSVINYANEARGVDPFSAFVAHQEKLVVLLSTGGTLASLAESGSGTLAGQAQERVWKQIVARDAQLIGAELNRKVFVPMLEAAFPGQPARAKFDLDMTEEPTAKEVFEIAAAAKASGYVVKQDDLERRTGYKLERDTSATATPGALTMSPNKASEEVVANSRPDAAAETALQTTRDAVAKRAEPQKGIDGGLAIAPALKRILDAFSAELGPAAERIKKLLLNLDAANAGAAAQEILELLPDNPEAATILAEETAKVAYGEVGVQDND